MIEIKRAVEIFEANLKCMERETLGNFDICDHDCINCALSYEQGTQEEQKEALKMAIEIMHTISERDIINHYKLYSLIFELMLNLENSNWLKLISATADKLISDIEEKEKLRVDDIETYKFDDTMKYDD